MSNLIEPLKVTLKAEYALVIVLSVIIVSLIILYFLILLTLWGINPEFIQEDGSLSIRKLFGFTTLFFIIIFVLLVIAYFTQKYSSIMNNLNTR